MGSALNVLRKIRRKRYKPVFRGSFALIGYYGPGRRSRWVKQNAKPRRRGPTEMSARVPLLRVPGKHMVLIILGNIIIESPVASIFSFPVTLVSGPVMSGKMDMSYYKSSRTSFPLRVRILLKYIK